MNPDEIQIETQEPGLAVAKDRAEENLRGKRIEPREFENLLQRAMEILSVRAQSIAQSAT